MAMSKASTCLDGEIRMALVGKTGVGKSSTGNTIAGNKRFVAKLYGASITQSCQQYTFEREGQNLQLIDVPGFCYTTLSEEDIKFEISRCIALSHPGLHAILFVIRVGRYTEEDIKTLDQFIRFFGEEAVRYVIVIFAGEDDLIADDVTLDEFVHGSPESLQKFLKSVNNRYLAVNNQGMKERYNLFVQNLLTHVQNMVRENGGECYTNKMYEKAEKTLTESQEKERKRIAEEKKAEYEEIIRKANVQHREEIRRNLEEEYHKEAIRRTRENIGFDDDRAQIVAYVGKQAFEYVGEIVGKVLAGPTGAAVGKAVGGFIGQIFLSK